MQATELGKLLYGNYGFQPIEDMDFTAPMTREKEKSEELKALEEKVGAVRCWFMRRLVGGKMG